MRRSMVLVFAFLFFPAFGLSRSHADDGASAPPPAAAASPVATATPASQLPPMTIVITPTRIAQPLEQTGVTTSVVNRSDLQTQQLQSAADALSEVPGVHVIQDGPPGTIADVQIRGASAEQSLIMLDGVPVNDAATDLFDISRLTTNDLDRIEVVRGAGGSLYGSQAIGGVVNLISREGSGPLKFSLLSEGGNRATQNQVATVDGAEGKLAYSGALSYFSTTAYRTRNDGSDNLNGSMRLDYHLDENTTIHGFARYIRANVSLASFSVYSGIPVNPNAHQRNEFFLFKGGIDHRFGEHLLLRTSAFWVRDELRLNALPFTGNPYQEADHDPDETRGGNLDLVGTWNEMFRTLVGFEFLDRWVHSQSDIVSPGAPFSGSGCQEFAVVGSPYARCLTVFNARRQEYAGYVQQEGRFFDGHLIATGGFRVDGNSNFGEEVSPSWSVAMPVGHGFTFRGNYAEGFRAPSFNELFFPGFGNPNLGPELSSEYDGGVTKTFGEYLAITTTYFSRRVHNQITAVPCQYNPATCPFGALAGNAGRVDTQGVELVPEAHPLRGLTLRGSFTFINQSHTSPASNERPLQVPKYSAASVVEYVSRNLFRDGDEVRLATNYTFVGDRDDITTSGTIGNHAAYNVVDGALSYSPGLRWGFIRNETVLVRVQNVMDRHYSVAFGFPSPPINFVSGVKVDF